MERSLDLCQRNRNERLGGDCSWYEGSWIFVLFSCDYKELPSSCSGSWKANGKKAYVEKHVYDVFQASNTVLLRLLASPCFWLDVIKVFRKYLSQLSEIFWEGMKTFL